MYFPSFKYILFFTVLFGLTFPGCTEPGIDDDDNDPNMTDDPTIISSNITEVTTLVDLFSEPDVADYRVTDASWTIEAGLIIEPGVVIEFDAGVLLNVSRNGGYLVANGTASQPIRFTAITKTAGSWKGILIRSEDTRNQLNHCVVEYGGGGELNFRIPFANIGIIKDGSNIGKLTVTNTSITNSAAYGLVTDRDSELSDFSTNTFANNTNAAVQLSPNNVSALDNSSDYVSGNGYNGVEILGGTLSRLTEQVWSNLGGGATYKLLGDLIIHSGLALLPNTTLQAGAGALIRINSNDGYLNAIGLSNRPIIFQGEVNAPGFWRGIVFNSEDSRNYMNRCTVSDAGGGELSFAIDDANIGVLSLSGREGRLFLSNCIINNGAGCGISSNTNAQLTYSNISFSNLAGNDLCD